MNSETVVVRVDSTSMSVAVAVLHEIWAPSGGGPLGYWRSDDYLGVLKCFSEDLGEYSAALIEARMDMAPFEMPKGG
jgi:hypothetical protein